MAASLERLRGELDAIMEPWRFADYCPNGLQVEGCQKIQRVVSGVTACQALIDAAIETDADALLVHHGYFWKGESPIITGMKRHRIASLLEHNINLFAYHLPLDAHPQLGNNAQLALRLGIDVEGSLEPGNASAVGNVGSLAQPLRVADLVKRVESALGRQVLHVGDVADEVSRVAWCTGGAQGYIDQAVAVGADVYITGEASEQTVHIAREEGIHFIAAGHHATERYGVQALGEEIARRLELEHRFVDIDNPV